MGSKCLVLILCQTHCVVVIHFYVPKFDQFDPLSVPNWDPSRLVGREFFWSCLAVSLSLTPTSTGSPLTLMIRFLLTLSLSTQNRSCSCYTIGTKITLVFAMVFSKVLWPLCSSMDQLQTHVDVANISMAVLKKLAQASEATCSQWVT